MTDLAQAFYSYIQEKLPSLEQELSSDLPKVSAGYDFSLQAELDQYLYGPFKSFSEVPGKRIRPLLCLLAAEAYGADATKALRAALAIEHFQSAALIHDDIADESELRRGEPCLHKQLGVGLAINVGDLALTWLVKQLLDDEHLDDSLKISVLKELMNMELMTLEGQALDLAWSQFEEYSIIEHDYLFMAQHKTAYYSAAIPLVIGALIAGADKSELSKLKEFGLRCGLAFQIQDDILNVKPSPKKNKDLYSDLQEGKRTLIVLRALEVLDADKSWRLRELLEKPENDADEILEMVTLLYQAKAPQYAHEFANKLLVESLEILSTLSIDDAYKKLLQGMAEFFVERSY